jgi:hypothetical protein
MRGKAFRYLGTLPISGIPDDKSGKRIRMKFALGPDWSHHHQVDFTIVRQKNYETKSILEFGTNIHPEKNRQNLYLPLFIYLHFRSDTKKL